MTTSSWLVSGSHLYTGQVMYLDFHPTSSSKWVYQIDQARPLNQTELKLALEQAQQDHRQNQVVDPYTIQLNSSSQPLKKRESIRITGPSVRPDLPPFPAPSSASSFTSQER